MSKRVVFAPIFQHIQGKFNLKDEDGCAMPVTFKEMSASGHRVLQLGESRKRNLEQKPYSQDELIHQGKFKIANAQTNLAMKDEAQKASFLTEYKAALKAGTTTANTLRGYVFAQFYKDAQYTPAPNPGGGGGTGSRTFTISVSSANEAQGSVSGGGTFSEGSRIILTATPKPGYAFDKWSNGKSTSTIEVLVSQNLSLVASFKAATGGGGDDDENYN